MLSTLKQTWRRIFQRNALRGAAHSDGHDHGLSALNHEKHSVLAELHRVQDEIDNAKSRDAELLAALNERITAMDAASEAASREIEELRGDLADAAVRQEQAETQIRLLRERQDKERREHQAFIQEALARERSQNRRLGWSMLLACCALLLGALAGTYAIRDGRQYSELLTELSRDIKDIKASMEQQLGSMHESLDEYRLSLLQGQTIGKIPDSKPAFSVRSVEPTKREQLESANTLSSFGFHPRNKFQSRSEMHAFFEENSRQLGVISLDSGLQYKVISHGNGRTPGPADRVVFEYQTFLADGTEIYSSYNDTEPAEYKLDEVIPGLREALQRMNEGAQWELYVPPELAHKGVRKRGRGEQAFEPLIYIVELKSVREGGQTIKN